MASEDKMEPLEEATSGDAPGDAGGGILSPIYGGKFWCLSAVDADGDALVSPRSLSPSPEAYRQSSPEFFLTQSSRCGDNGHFADTCTVVLCLYCEKTSHESKNCPLLSMPKPVETAYGVCRNELIFHEVPASSEVTFKHDSGKLGKISVDGGSLTPQEIVKELEWIIPGDYQWDLRPTDGGAFKVPFPSKADLARMAKIINVPVPGTIMYLHFEEWSAADVDKFYLTEVWVRVHGCCYKKRCDYLSLFAVGSLIGKAKEIDMEYTRAHLVVRMKVEVTRQEHIPTTIVDHTYDGEGYGLIFKVEAGSSKDKSDVDMQEANPGDDSNGSDGKGKELPKGAEPPPTGGPAKPSAANPIQSMPSTFSSNQAQTMSLPTLRVGSIDCYYYPKSKLVSMSDSKAINIAPHRLWGDSDNEEEDCLPSPLPRLSHADDVVVSEFFSQPQAIPLAAVTVANPAEFSVEAEKPFFFSAATHIDVGTVGVISCTPSDVVTRSPRHEVAVASDEEHQMSVKSGSEQEALPSQMGMVASLSSPNRSPRLPGGGSASPISSPTLGAEYIHKGTKCDHVQEHDVPFHINSILSPLFENAGVVPCTSSPIPVAREPEGLLREAGTGVFLGGRLSVDDVVAFGGIPSPSLDSRSSERIRHQHNADATQMERAQQLAQAKDTAVFLGTVHHLKYSLASIPDDIFLHRAKSMGVSLGASSSQVADTISNMKAVDNKRTLIMLSKNLEDNNQNENSQQNDALVHASDLSLDLCDEGKQISDDAVPICDRKITKVYKRKEKVAPKVVRRSVRMSKKT
ncbi:hypothetical protein ACQ4PT_002786 [Festuca glaucescens]